MKYLLAILLLLPLNAWAVATPPNCPTSAGTQALNYAMATNAYSCNPVIGASGLVSSFSGDGALLSNSGSTGAVTATLRNAAAQTIWGRDATSAGTPSYLTSAKALGTVFHWPLSTTTYPVGYINGTTTNASGTFTSYPFPERSSVFLGAAAGKSAAETTICSGGNVAIGNYALNALGTNQQCYFANNTYTLLGNGVQNTAVGDGALYSLNVSGATADFGYGSFNNAYGFLALGALTTGYRNNAFGESNSTVFTTGYFNNVFGTDSVHSTGSGGDGHDNSIFGTETCYSCGHSSYETIVGNQSAQAETGGFGNVMLGVFVGNTLTTGQYNILLGSTTDVPTATTNRSINIGNLLQGDWTNSTAIGNKTLNLRSVASQVDYIDLIGAATANPATVTVSALGSDSNINLALTPKGSGTVTSTTFTGALVGNATTATTATNATNTAITNDTTTNATMYPTWVTANTGNLPQKTSDTKLSFNPSTGVLTSTSFTGAGTGLTGTAASLTAGTASAVAVGGITGLGTGVATALAVNVGSAGAFVTFNGAGGTPSSMTATNLSGTAASLNIGGTAPAGTLTGVTLAAGVTASSLTSVGTLGSLTMGGALAMGANNITMTGSLAATGSRVTKGWFTDVESTNAPTVSGSAVYYSGGTDVTVADGGTGRSTGTTAYALVATGTTATGAQQTLANGATTEILVGGGASALPAWTTATGSGSPVRATAPAVTGITTDTIVASSTATALTFVPTGSSAPTNGMYLVAANEIGLSINSSLHLDIYSTAAEFNSSGDTFGTSKLGLYVHDTNTGGAAGVRAGFGFNYNDGTVADRTGAGIYASKENSTSGQYGTSLILGTRANGANVADVLTLTSAKAATFAGTLSVAGITNVATTSAVCVNTASGLLTYDGTLGTCTVSDGRLKNIDGPITSALDKLLQIKGIYFHWNDPSFGSGRQAGVIAQDVEKVFPELVSTDSRGLKSADYQRLTAPIIEALRELKADNDNLHHELEELKKRKDK